MKESKIEVLKSFCAEVESFDYTKKYRSGNIVRFLNEDGKRVNCKNKPVDTVQILDFVFDQQVVFNYCDKDGSNKIFTEKSLLVVERDGIHFGSLKDCKNGKSFGFQIKKNKLTKFKEEKGKDL